MLFQVGEIGTDGLSRVLGFKGFQELGLDVVPDGQIDGVIAERLPPDKGPFSEAQLKLPNFAGFVPGSNFSGILDAVD
jgi:hypothetical protein